MLKTMNIIGNNGKEVQHRKVEKMWESLKLEFNVYLLKECVLMLMEKLKNMVI